MPKTPPSHRELSKLRPSGALVDLVENFLHEKYPSRKRALVSASVLALILELDELKKPFPPRQQVADALNCSIFGVDAAISVALGRGLLSVEIKVLQGNVEQRDSAIRERYLIPSARLRGVVARARAKSPAVA